MGERLHSGVSAGIILGKFAVYLKYAMPSVSVVCSWIFCSLKVWRLSNDATVREKQSVFGLAEAVKKASEATLGSGSVEQVDIGLAKSLLPSVYVLYAVLIIASVLALWQLLFSAAAFSKPAEGPEANRIKVWFSVLFPKSAVQFLIPFLAVVPQLLPQYVIGRFAEYYRVSGMENNAPTYYDYGARAIGFNPLVFSLVFAFVSAVVFFAVRGQEKKHMLDMYKHFEKEPENTVKQRRRY